MFSGTVRIRDRHGEDKVTAISVFDEGGAAMRSESIAAGQIGKVWGLAAVRIGDAIGARRGNADHHFAPPTLETVVAPCRDEDSGRLRVALAQLAEQDPLIDVRQDDSVRELSVSLYGEVQKEVIGATLASDYGLGVTFREATPSTSSALSRRARRSRSSTRTRIRSMPRSGYASIRRPQARGTTSCSTSIPRTVPLYVYKTLESFTDHMAEYVRRALREGLAGWRVTDCVVTMTTCAYSIPDGPPSRRGPRSTAADFRKLTPLVVKRALEHAGTVVCEPLVRAELELPPEAIGAVMPALGRLGAAVDGPSVEDGVARIETVLPAAQLHDLQRSSRC